jgi:hypothetical protein
MEPPPFIVPDSIEHRLRLALERGPLAGVSFV